MARQVAQKYKDELSSLKRCVENWHDYFNENNERFDFFKKFVFKTSLSAADEATLKELGKPPLEFNICEAYLSRLRGIFAEHEPSVMVRASEGLSVKEITPTLNQTIDVVEGHIREIFSRGKNDGLEYKVYTDCLAGGFSGIRVGTEYVNEMSFDQRIILEKVFDPTMMGFDPLARLSHKGDGAYCFELVPVTKEDIEMRYGKEVAEKISYVRSNTDGFNWSYSTTDNKTKVAIITYLYKKVKKRKKIAKLTNGKSIYYENYEKILEAWEEMGLIEQPPKILDVRHTEIEQIYLYEFCESDVLNVTETSYSHLPIVFIDGNSTSIRSGDAGRLKQFTRPYLYHAKDIQKLKNFAGQTMAQEIENLLQQKIMIASETIDPEYEDTLTNPQKYQAMVYRAFHNNDPDKPLPPPQIIQRPSMPPLVESMFMGSDAVTQSILGSYDAQQGIIESKELSGKAIEAGAIQSDTASRPYLMGYIIGLNRVAQIVLDLIPKYFVTPRTIPVIRKNGLREYQTINDPWDQGSIKMQYEPSSMQVDVTMGINSSAQKRMALDHIVRLMGSSDLFNEFMNTEGLEPLLDNIDIRGADKLKETAIKFMEQRKQAMAMSANEPSPEEKLIESQLQAERERTAQKQQEAQLKHSQEMAKIAIDQEKLDLDWFDVLSKVDEREAKQALESAKLDAKITKEAIDTTRDMLEKVDITVVNIDEV